AIVLIPAGLAAAVAHDRAHLIFRALKLFGSWRLNENHQRARGAECATRDIQAKVFLVCREGNIDPVVARDAENLSQRREHSNDSIWATAGPNLLAHSPIRRLIRKQVSNHVRSDYGNVVRGAALRFTPKPPDGAR